MTYLGFFAILAIEYTPCYGGVTITVTTDAPCHLYMRWTNQLPLIHQDPYIRRGAAVGTTPRFCFDVYHDNEQIEPGDTLVHTFYKPAWSCCETRYFYFWGSYAGVVSPSESAIFEYHNPYQNPQTVYCPIYGQPCIWGATDPDWTVVQTKAPHTCQYGVGIQCRVHNTGATYHILRAAFTIDTTPIPPLSHICEAKFRFYDHVTSWWLPNTGDFNVYVVNANNWDGLPTCSWYPIFNDWYETHCIFYVPPQKSKSCSEYPLNEIGKDHLTLGGLQRYLIEIEDDYQNTFPPVKDQSYYIEHTHAACLAHLEVTFCPPC